MTDNFEKDINVPSKKIIIDGVDVSGCESFCRGICCQEGFGAGASCKLFSDCLYKQLKRKEQECERLKEKYLELKEQNGSNIVLLNTANEQLDQLKTELEQEQALKETYLACYRTKHEELADKYETLKAENEELKEIIQRHDNDNNALLSEFEDDLVEYYRRHRECLIEIKEIANKFDYWNSNLSQASEILHEIIEKISEVLDEDI